MNGTATVSLSATLNAAARAASEAEDALAITLTPEQKPLYAALLVAYRDDEDAHVAWVIEGLARHLPGAAPAIRALGYDHLMDSDDRDATCCTDGGQSSRRTAPSAATRSPEPRSPHRGALPSAR